MSHPWMPSSPCGDGCVIDGARVGAIRAGLRCAGLVAVLSALPLFAVGAVLPPRWRARLRRRYARSALWVLGLRLRIGDERTRIPGAGGVLVVAGHVSWLDVLALTAVEPGVFVARADLLGWPLIGPLTRRMRIVPIDRARLRTLPGVVGDVASRLRAGTRVVVFPEGTTWCGRAYGRLRPALFQAAIDAGTVVAPIALRYTGPGGETATGVCFVGDQSLAASLRRILRLRAVTVDVRFAPLQQPGTDRRELAARCDRLIRGGPRASEVAPAPVRPRGAPLAA